MINVRVNSNDLQKSLQIFSSALNRDLETSYKELGSLTARKLASITPPPGVGNKQRDILRKAVLKDVGATFWDVGRTANEIDKIAGRQMMAAFLQAVHAGNNTRAEEIVRNTLHKVDDYKINPTASYLKNTRRGPKRRVNKESVHPQSIWNKSGIDAIKKTESMTAGMAKAGWMSCSSQLGSRTAIPKWLRQGLLGTFSLIKTGGNFIMSITNNVRYASNLLTEGEIKRTVEVSVRNHMKRLEMMVDKLTKKV